MVTSFSLATDTGEPGRGDAAGLLTAARVRSTSDEVSVAGGNLLLGQRVGLLQAP